MTERLFTEVDSNGTVLRVIVCDSQEWCEKTLGGTWIETTPERKNYAGIGYTYDKARDAFISPKPAVDATLDEQTCQWRHPASLEQPSVDVVKGNSTT